MKRLLASYVLFLVVASGCVSTPTGNQLTPEGQAALTVSVRIAVRHAIVDSPRAAEKAAHIRAIVAKVQGVLTAESTLGALKDAVKVEIAKLNLSPLDLADANDLLDLFAVALEARLGPGSLNSEGLVRVSQFLDIVLTALPPPATA